MPRVMNMQPVTLRDIKSKIGMPESREIPSSNQVNSAIQSGASSLGISTGGVAAAITGDRFMVNGNAFAQVTGPSGKVATVNTSDILPVNLRHIALLDHLSAVNGLPPIPDNVVDPPIEILATDLKEEIPSWGKMVGKDYIRRVLANGQFLVLVPLDLVPSNFGALGQGDNEIKNTVESFLGTVERRLDVTSYGFHSKVNATKYWTTVQAHFKTALVALGIQSASQDYPDKSIFLKYMPDEIVEKVLFNNRTNLFSKLREGGGAENAESTRVAEAGALKQFFASGGKSAVNSQSNMEAVSADALADFAVNQGLADLMKWITNIDTNDTAIQNLPFTVFYCNGPVERSMASSTELGESAVAKMTTDIGSAGIKNVMGDVLSGISNATGALVDVSSGDAEEYIKELAYHNGFGSKIVANTWIPKVIKNSLMAQTYTVNIKEMVASSDRFSKARVQWTLCQLIPFVVPTNEPDQPNLMPRSAMYCSAFVKGVMNLPRAAVTSMSVRTSPEFQTSEGIPTELEIALTIQPLYDLSAMPDFDRWYSGASDVTFVAASAYNPQSSFNLIATMCGQNTILTKFNVGMLQFFLGGTVDSIFNSVKNTGNYMSGAWTDFKSSTGISKNNIMSSVRLF